MRGNRTHAGFKRGLLATTAFAIGASGTAYAAPDEEEGGVRIIVVEAQKRAQNVQDVPIAVTALGDEELQANRVAAVTDLTGLAPGLTVAESAGGQKIPFFVMRGANSAGLVPGSDKQISLYLDGVYLASTRGSIFDLPDVSRIEVLRGPQGTLFGRNATGGAVSVFTRDPTGEIGARFEGTVGNYGHYRIVGSLDLPQFGPFSGYVSYVRNYRRGDIRNVAPGQVWDRGASLTERNRKIKRSPEYFGTTDAHGIFAALKFESGDFTTVYKYDWNQDKGTTRGTALVDYNATIPLLGPFLDTLIRTQPNPVPLAPDARRPKAVSNAFVVPSDQENQGHSLTSTYQFTDNFSVKNIAAFRKAYIAGPSSIDGVSSLIITQESILPFAVLAAFSSVPGLGQADPETQAFVIGQFAEGLAPLVGSPFVAVAGMPEARSKQWSDEIQFNYESDFLTATAGGLWFMSKEWTNEHGFQNTYGFTPIFRGIVPIANLGITFNKAVSLAAYAQLEFHVTPQIDIVGGVRVTRDKKDGTFTFGRTLATLQTASFSYRKTKPTYLAGVNWKPNDDILVYAKFSTGYVSGGSVAGIPFDPETVTSWEGGVKAELFNRRLRANLAVFHASYKNVQQPSAPTTPETQELVDRVTGNPLLKEFIGVFVADLGDVKAKGFELDVAAVPVTGLNVGGSLSFTDSDYVFIDPLQIPSSGILPHLNNRARWRASLFGQYDTPPVGIGDAYVSIRGDAFWQDSYLLTPFADEPIYQPGGFAAPIRSTPSYWLFNGRISLRDLEIGGARAEIGLWGRNLTDEKAPNAGLNLGGILASANFIPARTYGVDVILEF
jgi:iron complex outermembrane recepter protein